MVSRMSQHRASFWSSFVALALALACFGAAASFQSHSRRHDSPLAWWMFFASAAVFVLAVVMAARHRYWFDWLAAAIVAGITLAIPLLLIWVI